jgi:hypothetical protein
VVYRDDARTVGQPESQSEIVLRVDASGARGRDGVHGKAGIDGGGYGMSGSRGEHAGPAERGKDAGWVRAVLEPAGGDAMVVRGERAPEGAPSERFVEEVQSVAACALRVGRPRYTASVSVSARGRDYHMLHTRPGG